MAENKSEKTELSVTLKNARERLSALQMPLKEKKVPVLVVFDGWGAAGKGSILGKVIKNLDPRFYKVRTFAKRTKEEQRYPFLRRYFTEIPEAGKLAFFDGCWMDEIVKEKVFDKQGDDAFLEKIESVKRFERQLSDNGYVLIKFFFDVPKDEQKKRIEKLKEKKSTAWRAGKWDLWQTQHYRRCAEAFETYRRMAELPVAPWHVIDSSDRKQAELAVTECIVRCIENALENVGRAVPIPQNTFPLIAAPKLAEIALDKQLEKDDYDHKLDKLQKKLASLHNKLYRQKIPVIIAYEGWDAAGKGGNIKRLTAALDPRGFEVHPIASPEPAEKNRHYLWRFWNRLPKDGHIAVFDRTWYGRVMVERLEGFCSQNDWSRAYNEINEFEKELHDWGAVILKFWVQIDKDTQLARFTDRQNTPEKQWKITDEDWRNREKWDLYESAVDEMIQKTSTVYAPWYVLESNDKRYARIKALEIVIDALEEVL